MQEALRYVPAVQSELSGRTGFDELQVRGFNASRYQFKDGLRLDPGYLQQQEQWGLESIEVLRGPTSVLYGQVAPGGIVNSVSKRADGGRHRTIGVTAGSFGLATVFADLGDRLDDDGRWSVRLPLLAMRRDDYQDAVGASRVFVAPSLAWQPSERTQLTLLGVFQRDAYDRTQPLPVAGTIAPNPNGEIPSRRFLGEPALPQLETDQLQLGYLVSHRLSRALSARQSVRYMRYTVDGPITQVNRGGSTDRGSARRYFVYDGAPELWSIDNQVEATAGTAAIEHRLLAGLDYQRADDENGGDLFGLQPIDVFRPVYGSPIEARGPFFRSRTALRQLGVYTQYRARIAERLVATAGARRSATRTQSTDVASGATSRQDDDATTLSGALLWIAPWRVTPYVSYAESFEPQVGNDPLPGGVQPPPSAGRQVEFGATWTAPSGAHDVRLAVFDLRQSDIVNGDPDNPGFSVLIGAQRHRGAEVEARSAVANVVRLSASAAYLDARITRSLNGDQGLVPLNVPRWSTALVARLDGASLGLRGSDAHVALRQASTRRATGDGRSLPAFTLVDIGARHRLGALTAALNLKNVFDRRWFAGAVGNGVVVGEGRALQVTLRSDF
ncbi:MAG: TonB-dependent siderophore receptor [Gemmatimonadaceae bacterium]|nr:TonB-dependent siderophore receptor [Gemmatimonadaceae bacterium]